MERPEAIRGLENIFPFWGMSEFEPALQRVSDPAGPRQASLDLEAGSGVCRMGSGATGPATRCLQSEAPAAPERVASQVYPGQSPQDTGLPASVGSTRARHRESAGFFL